MLPAAGVVLRQDIAEDPGEFTELAADRNEPVRVFLELKLRCFEEDRELVEKVVLWYAVKGVEEGTR